jgi:hypothetical protein
MKEFSATHCDSAEGADVRSRTPMAKKAKKAKAAPKKAAKAKKR